MTPRFPKPALFVLAALSVVAFSPAAEAQATFERSLQGPNGRGLSVQGTRGYDAATGTRSGSRTITTNDGRSVTRQVTGACAQPSGGEVECSRQTTTSGADKSATSTTTRSLGNGTATRSVTRQGPNGNTLTRQRWITINP